ncbi:YraN family protein [Parabacteroides sp. OttesenSCG-928-G07]|nr:YraN family protein [Parabacteroides sp. OttesenSCG-928-G21]MDL2278982.1 YraN family protein [Parabacteroides sp. OttesenSCG-928-G07]
MAERNDTGRAGESFAQTYLKKKGYMILHTNWHWHHFELDIVATDGEWLVIVEVKTRSADYLTSPEEAVDRKKMKRIIAAADAYIRLFNISSPARFDIISLVKMEEGYQVEHIEDAFLPSCR